MPSKRLPDSGYSAIRLACVECQLGEWWESRQGRLRHAFKIDTGLRLAALVRHDLAAGGDALAADGVETGKSEAWLGEPIRGRIRSRSYRFSARAERG